MDHEGWLVHQHKRWSYRFLRDQESWVENPYIYVDKGDTSFKPPLLKTRTHMNRYQAIVLWNKLLDEGYLKFPPQW